MTLGSIVKTEPFTENSIRFIFHSFFLVPQQRKLHRSCEHEFPAMKVLSLWQKLFLRELTSTCLFHHICSFQTAFQGDEMILLSAISVQRSPAPHARRPGPPGSSAVSVPGGGALGQRRLNLHFPRDFWTETSSRVCRWVALLWIAYLCPLSCWLLTICLLSISRSLCSIIDIHHSSVVGFTNTYFSKFIIFILFVYGFFFHRTFAIPAEPNGSAPLV